MAEIINFEPLALLGNPSCNDCLAWSEDHLAVAVGKSVHIVTPLPPGSTAKRISEPWHKETLLVSQFEEGEWPYQELAPLNDLALGEEQSESTVTSLAWSPPGLGLHKRSVLAVLTSNLILSFWESDGTPGSWRRTIFFNRKTNESDAGFTGFKRRGQRVRAFAWLPALNHSTASRWGMHHLLTVDDNNVITCFHVQKDNVPAFEWTLSNVYQTNLWTSERPFLDDQASPLQHLLLTQSSTTKIATGSWQTLGNESGAAQRFRIQLNFRRGSAAALNPETPHILEVQLTAAGVDFTDLSRVPTTVPVIDDLLLPEDFEQAIAPLAEQFSVKFNLHGQVRVRYWGFAKNAKSSVIAACITLHPLDMIEDLFSSDGRTMLIFTASDHDSQESQPVTNDPPAVRIFSWIRSHANKDNAKSGIDEKAVSVAAEAVRAAFSHNDDLMEWSRSAQGLLVSSPDDGQGVNGDIQMSGAANETPSRNSGFVPTNSNMEVCEVCDSKVLMTATLSSARCAKGHTFARCGISFLAIQEPGISKYCSRCGMEFLDLLKLAPPSGPSLLQALFEKFDICPYCQGKFRG